MPRQGSSVSSVQFVRGCGCFLSNLQSCWTAGPDLINFTYSRGRAGDLLWLSMCCCLSPYGIMSAHGRSVSGR